MAIASMHQAEEGEDQKTTKAKYKRGISGESMFSSNDLHENNAH